MSRTTFLALAALFLLAGIGSLLAAVRLVAARRAFMARSARAQGEVIGFEDRRSGSEDPSRFPSVRFRTQAGAAMTFSSQLGSERPSLRLGDLVRVRYHVDQPAEAEIESFLALWGLALVLATLGAIFATLGASLLLGWIQP